MSLCRWAILLYSPTDVCVSLVCLCVRVGTLTLWLCGQLTRPYAHSWLSWVFRNWWSNYAANAKFHDFAASSVAISLSVYLQDACNLMEKHLHTHSHSYTHIYNADCHTDFGKVWRFPLAIAHFPGDWQASACPLPVVGLSSRWTVPDNTQSYSSSIGIICEV